MKIGIDFDGTVCNRKGVPRKGDFLYDPPMENALQSIWWLQRQGYEPYILTSREEKDFTAIYLWLYYHGFPAIEITNKKKNGTIALVDDRAIRFENNWQSICKYFG